MKIDLWSDIACPWCYIGVTRFEKALAQFPHRDGVEVVLHSYQLDPTLPEAYDGTELDYLAARKGMAPDQVRAMFGHVSQAASEDGLVLDFDSVAVANSRRAHRLLHEASAADPTGATTWALKKSLFAAHFTRGESIWDADVLVRLATEAGLDADAARAALDDNERDREVEADITRAGQMGVTGVPFFVLADKYGVSGAQPEEFFAQALAQVWDEVHPAPTPLETLSVGVTSGPSCGIDGCD